MTLDDTGSVLALGAGLVFLIPLLLVGLVVIVVVSNRADPDPTGRRPLAVYLFAASFITLFVTMFASLGVVARVCSLIGKNVTGLSTGDFSDSESDFSDFSSFSDDSSSGFGDSSGSLSTSQHPVGDAVSREVVIFLLIGLVAGAALYFHLRAAGRLSDPGARSGPVGRVRSSYVAAVSFVCVLLAVVSAILTLYAVFRLISPTIFAPGGDGSRSEAFRTLVPGLYFTALSLFVLVAHLRATPSDQRPLFRRPRPVAPVSGPYDVTAASTYPAAPELAVVPGDYPAAPATPPPTGTGAPTGADVLGEAPPAPRRRPRPKD